MKLSDMYGVYKALENLKKSHRYWAEHDDDYLVVEDAVAELEFLLKKCEPEDVRKEYHWFYPVGSTEQVKGFTTYCPACGKKVFQHRGEYCSVCGKRLNFNVGEEIKNG